MPPELSLSVQYATPAPELPRWRLRRWVLHALKGAHPHAANKLADINMVSLTLRLVDTTEGQELNRDFRQRDYATNILTFAYGTDPSGTLHADLVICVPVLEQEASTQRKPLRNHAAHLTMHGVLHALGYDHIDSDEAQEMEALETLLLAQLGIPDPYLA
ncbi:rRNA maturation RNase YbeY [Alcaligenaceae bacterium]|nr:rRNA maturation RNase YbeY [Alcaligenaceae bacterium]